MKISREIRVITTAVLIIAICAFFILIVFFWSKSTSSNRNESAAATGATGTEIIVQEANATAVASVEITATDNAAAKVTVDPSSEGSFSKPAETEAAAIGSDNTDATIAVPSESPDSANQSGKEDGQSMAALKAQILDSIGKLDSVWDVYIERLDDSSSISCTCNLPKDGQVVSASIIKIFIMGVIYEQISLGKIEEDIATPDLELMIAISDNDATNRLIKLLGGGDSEKGFNIVNRFADGLGCQHTELNRLMLDWDKGLENYTSSSDCAKFLNLVYYGKCINETYSTKMMTLLKAQEKNEGLKWPIPKGVTVASKPGYISGVSIGDVGIVFTDKADYIICVICNEPYTDDGAKQEISDISKMVYSYFSE